MSCTYCDEPCEEFDGWGANAWTCRECRQSSCDPCSRLVFAELSQDCDDYGSDELLCNQCQPGISDDKRGAIELCKKYVEQATRELSRAKARLLRNVEKEDGGTREKRKRPDPTDSPEKKANQGSLDDPIDV